MKEDKKIQELRTYIRLALLSEESFSRGNYADFLTQKLLNTSGKRGGFFGFIKGLFKGGAQKKIDEIVDDFLDEMEDYYEITYDDSEEQEMRAFAKKKFSELVQKTRDEETAYSKLPYALKAKYGPVRR